MIDLEVVFSVLIGGALTLLGTLLANYLQYRSEQRGLRKELAKERFAEVRRYISTCLEFVELVSIPTTIGPKNFGARSYNEWISLIKEHLEKWKSLPVSGSARVLFVTDKEVLEGLTKIDDIRLRFYFNYLSMIESGQMIQLDDQREKLEEIASRVGKRLDEILAKI